MEHSLNESREYHDLSFNSSFINEAEFSHSRIGKNESPQASKSFTQSANPILLPPFLLGEPSTKSMTGRSRPKEEKTTSDGSPATPTTEPEKPKWPPVRTQKDLLENYNFEYSPIYPKKPWADEFSKLPSDAAVAMECDKRSHWARLWVTVLGAPASLGGRRRILRFVEQICGEAGCVAEVVGAVASSGTRPMHLRLTSPHLVTRLLRHNGGVLEQPWEGPPVRVQVCANQTVLNKYEELGKTKDQERLSPAKVSPQSERYRKSTNRLVEWAVQQARADYSVRPEMSLITQPRPLRPSWNEELLMQSNSF